MNERCRAGPRSRLRPEERCRSAFEPRSVADKAGVAHIRAWDADCNYVVGRHDVKAGCKAQRNITQTRHDVRECTITHSCVTSPPLGLFCSAWVLIAVLLLPSVLKNSALRAIAAFVSPWASRASALTPIAVFSLLTVLLKAARSPTAVLY